VAGVLGGIVVLGTGFALVAAYNAQKPPLKGLQEAYKVKDELLDTEKGSGSKSLPMQKALRDVMAVGILPLSQNQNYKQK